MNNIPVCINYSLVNKQCRFLYEISLIMSGKDIIKGCDGRKTNQECCYYQAYRNYGGKRK